MDLPISLLGSSATFLLMTHNNVGVDISATSKISLKRLSSRGSLIRLDKLVQVVVVMSVQSHWSAFASIFHIT